MVPARPLVITLRWRRSSRRRNSRRESSEVLACAWRDCWICLALGDLGLELADLVGELHGGIGPRGGAGATAELGEGGPGGFKLGGDGGNLGGILLRGRPGAGGLLGGGGEFALEVGGVLVGGFDLSQAGLQVFGVLFGAVRVDLGRLGGLLEALLGGLEPGHVQVAQGSGRQEQAPGGEEENFGEGHTKRRWEAVRGDDAERTSDWAGFWQAASQRASKKISPLETITYAEEPPFPPRGVRGHISPLRADGDRLKVTAPGTMDVRLTNPARAGRQQR